MKNKIELKDENGRFYFGWYVVIMGFILMIFGYSCIVSVSGVFYAAGYGRTGAADW